MFLLIIIFKDYVDHMGLDQSIGIPGGGPSGSGPSGRGPSGNGPSGSGPSCIVSGIYYGYGYGSGSGWNSGSGSTWLLIC